MTKKILFLLIGVILLVSVLVQAEDSEENHFSGDFFIGYRLANNNGAEYKYQEDINLSSGARLFKFNLTFQPTGSLKNVIDMVQVALSNFGGDPFETFDLSVVKHGKYNFSYQRQKASYFYQDVLWTSPLLFDEMRASVGGDLHHYDFERVIDRASLKVWLSRQAHFYFAFDRFSKKGNSTTTLDLARDEFEMDKPIDQSSKEITLGLALSLNKVGISFEEKIRDFKDSNSLFLPGFSEGEYFGYPTANYANLSLFILDMPYDTRSFSHTLRMNARPFKNFIIKASASIFNLKVNNLDYLEKAQGTNYDQLPLLYTYLDKSFDLKRDVQLYDVDLSYLLSDKLALVAAFRTSTHDQQGEVQIEGTPAPSTTQFSMEETFHNIGFDAGIQYQPLSRLAFTVGVRSESRTITFTADENRPDEKTKRTGLFGNFSWYASKNFNLTFDYQHGSISEPFSPISPSTLSRLRITARYNKGGFFASTSYLMTGSKSDVPLYHPTIQEPASGWDSKVQQFNLRVGYGNQKLMVSAGYNLVSTMNTANDRIHTAILTWPIYFSGKVNMVDFNLNYKICAKWALGGYVNYYSAPAYYGGYNTYPFITAGIPIFTKDTDYENRDLSRLSFKPYVEYTMAGGFVTQISYWFIDYKDKLQVVNNSYKSNIWEISFGYRW